MAQVKLNHLGTHITDSVLDVRTVLFASTGKDLVVGKKRKQPEDEFVAILTFGYMPDISVAKIVAILEKVEKSVQQYDTLVEITGYFCIVPFDDKPSQPNHKIYSVKAKTLQDYIQRNISFLDLLETIDSKSVKA